MKLDIMIMGLLGRKGCNRELPCLYTTIDGTYDKRSGNIFVSLSHPDGNGRVHGEYCKGGGFETENHIQIVV